MIPVGPEILRLRHILHVLLLLDWTGRLADTHRRRRQTPALADEPQGVTIPSVHADDNTRDLEQEVAAGQSETTPVALISTVIAVIAVLFVIALALAVLAYALA